MISLILIATITVSLSIYLLLKVNTVTRYFSVILTIVISACFLTRFSYYEATIRLFGLLCLISFASVILEYSLRDKLEEEFKKKS